ncbi:MAG: hypothetical protein K0R57_2058 [Paenibacillaceae bacterium]|jgi:uncharacterized metal-binding protein|nr:hypothetical protein [Paenibacillaceae bacterium]
MSDLNFSCTSCGINSCRTRAADFPRNCPTTAAEGNLLEESLDPYRQEGLISRVAHAAAEVEGQYYGKLTRVEEIIAFARKLGVKKIGIATCAGLIQESRIFSRILKAKKIDHYGVICKVGGIDKTEIGILEEYKIRQGTHESLCNPILQAKILNEQKTDLNVIVGLCVGHDSLFIKHSDALVTTLITKDRITGHNPAAALYASHSYYSRLLADEQI